MFSGIKNARCPLSDDGLLGSFQQHLHERRERMRTVKARLCNPQTKLSDFACGHEYFGLHKTNTCWVFREWAPHATRIVLIGEFSDWEEREEYALTQGKDGVWSIKLDLGILNHGMLYRLSVYWAEGNGQRLPAWCRREVQDPHTHIFNAQVWDPPQKYEWQCLESPTHKHPIIYETHVGMSTEEEKVASWQEFRVQVLPRLIHSGYNTLQIMAVVEHPYYGSFGYHVSGFFALSSRFGTPEEFKALVDEAHRYGFMVIIDLVHSHAVRNEVEGLGRFDGTRYQYFHEGSRGEHPAWDSYCFNYGKDEVLHFLLSNCRFWIDEYKIDGFRFDGITSMLYKHHGLGVSFGHYDHYFNDLVDEDAYCYLALANELIHELRPDAITIAEDVSGMPGLGAPVEEGGCGFDYRLAMGVTDYWFKLFDIPDEHWDMWQLWHELTNKRSDESTISYVECHDQALVGGKTAIFTMTDAEIYWNMHKNSNNLLVDRAVALHKLTRLLTVTTAGDGYLNFMGNEFGHPEWIDFPREGNGWSYAKCRRQWSLVEDDNLRFQALLYFDRALLNLIAKHEILDYRIQTLVIDDEKKIIAFERGGLFFFVNLHPTNSYADYTVKTLAGVYLLKLDTDHRKFDGHDRIEEHQQFFTRENKTGNEVSYDLSLYLPCRSALVLERSFSE